VSVYPSGKRGTYRYDFWVDGRRYTGTCRTTNKRAAERIESTLRGRAIEGQLERRHGIRPKRVAPSIAAFGELEWLPAIKNNYARHTWANGQSAFRRLAALYGALPLDAVDAARVERFKTLRLQGAKADELDGRESWTPVSSNQLRVDFKWLRNLYRLAIARGYVRTSPFEGAKLPPAVQTSYYIPSEEEEQQLYAKVDHPTALKVIRILLLTSLRVGEALKLQVSQVDLTHRVLLVPQGKVRRRVKTVPLVDEAVEMLRAEIPQGAPHDAYVFRSPLTRRPYTYHGFYYHWDGTRRAAGLAQVHLHHLRHTVAIRLARSGADRSEIGAILGHKPGSRATEIYVQHVAEERLRAAMTRMVVARGVRGTFDGTSG
jgi:integrase